MRTERIGAIVGNWNDRHNGGDSETTHKRPKLWHLLDRLAHWLYVRGEKP